MCINLCLRVELYQVLLTSFSSKSKYFAVLDTSFLCYDVTIMQQSTIKKIVYYLLALTPICLWIVADGKWLDIIPSTSGDQGLFFPFISGKNLLFRLLVDAAFIGWLILLYQNKEYVVRKTWITIAITAFTVIILIADIFGSDPISSLFSGFERMEGFVGQVHYFMYFIVLTSIFRQKSEWKKFSQWFFATNILVGLYGLFQLLGSKNYFFYNSYPKIGEIFEIIFPVHQGARIDSTLGNPAYYAMLSVYFIFLSLYGIAITKKPSIKVILTLSVLANFYLLIYTSTRSAVFGLVAGVVIAGSIFLFGSKKYLYEWIAIIVLSIALIASVFTKIGQTLPLFYLILGLIIITSIKSLLISTEKTKKLVAGIFIIVISGVVFFTLMRKSDYVTSSMFLGRFSNISAADPTASSRITVWKMSIEGFKEHPILGWGQDNFPYVFTKYHDPHMYAQEPWFDRSHNVFFDWLIAGGILALFAHLALYFLAAFLTHKTKGFSHTEKSIIYGILVAQFINNLFIFDNLASYLFFTALLAYISSVYSDGNKEVKDVSFDGQKEWIVPVGILLTLVLCTYSVVIPYYANAATVRGMQNYRGDALNVMQEKRNGFETALTLGYVGKREIHEQFVSTTLTMIGFDERQFEPQQASAILAEKSKWLDDLNETAFLDIQSNNKDMRAYELYGGFYLRINDLEKAGPLLIKAHEFSPKRQRTSFNLMQYYLLKGDIHNAYLLSKETYLLVPEFNMARKAYASLSLREGEQAFKDAISDMRSRGLKMVYPTSIASELIGLTDKKRMDIFVNALLTDYPEKATELRKEYKDLSVKK